MSGRPDLRDPRAPILRRLARRIVGLYPPAWRERYGDELLALVDDTRGGWRQIVDLARGAARERLSRSDAAPLWRPVARWTGTLAAAYLATVLTDMLLAVAAWFFFEIRAGIFHPAMFMLSFSSEITFLNGYYVREFSSEFYWLFHAALFGYSLVFSMPVAVILWISRVRRTYSRMAQAVWLVGFLAFTVWLGAAMTVGGFMVGRVFGSLQLSLAVGGCILARRLFPKSEAPALVPAGAISL